jgi:hypothetical protein
MLPGIPPTGRRVEVPLVVIVRFRNGKLAHEHIYWDQASVLVQLGLLDQRSSRLRARKAPERCSIPPCRPMRLCDVDGAEALCQKNRFAERRKRASSAIRHGGSVCCDRSPLPVFQKLG